MYFQDITSNENDPAVTLHWFRGGWSHFRIYRLTLFSLYLPVCQVITLYPYVRQNEDELSFKQNQVLNVVSKEDPDWWTGELGGVKGVFPSNYVKEWTSSTANTCEYF